MTNKRVEEFLKNAENIETNNISLIKKITILNFSFETIIRV